MLDAVVDFTAYCICKLLSSIKNTLSFCYKLQLGYISAKGGKTSLPDISLSIASEKTNAQLFLNITYQKWDGIKQKLSKSGQKSPFTNKVNL